jgi:hypothetical protein
LRGQTSIAKPAFHNAPGGATASRSFCTPKIHIVVNHFGHNNNNMGSAPSKPAVPLPVVAAAASREEEKEEAASADRMEQHPSAAFSSPTNKATMAHHRHHQEEDGWHSFVPFADPHQHHHDHPSSFSGNKEDRTKK